MNVRFLSVALEEANEAIEHYEEVEPGLGLRFLSQFRSGVERIKAHPQAWAKLSKRTYRCRTKVFPYGIIYQIRETEILIVAVMHMSRKPGYWKDRL